MNTVQIKLEGSPLRITLPGKGAVVGSVADHLATTLLFERGEEHAGDSLLLFLTDKETVFPAVNLGTGSEFPLSDLYTRTPTLKLQAAYERGGEIIANSNVALLFLRESIGREARGDAPSFGTISEIAEKSVTDASLEGSRLLFYNHAGEQVDSVSLEGLGGAEIQTAEPNASSTDDEATSAKRLWSMTGGSMSSLPTKAKTIVGAIRELQASLSELVTATNGYGLEADFENNVFTRIGGAAGKSAGADFDGVNAFGGRRRCNVLDDGRITAYYGDANYAEDGTNGQVMVYQPRFYYRMVPLKLSPIEGGSGYHILKAQYFVSDVPASGFKVHPWFVVDGKELPYRLASAYEACLFDVSAGAYNKTDAQTTDFTAGTGDKLSSIAGAKPATGETQNLNRVTLRTLAANRGSGWTQATIQGSAATQLLFAIEYAGFNSQTAIGRGVTDKPDNLTTNDAEVTGQTAFLGNASGMAAGTNGLASVSYRGQENLWGNTMHCLDGITIWGDGAMRGGSAYIADHDFEENKLAAPYAKMGMTLPNAFGYFTRFGYADPFFDWAFLPSETVTTPPTFSGDSCYVRPNRADYAPAVAGNSWFAKDLAGLFAILTDNTGKSRANRLGGRLEYAPSIG